LGKSESEGRGGKGREGEGREGKGREGKGREGKGREGKENYCQLQRVAVVSPEEHPPLSVVSSASSADN